MVLPTVLLFTLGMAWLVGIGVTHVRAVDAAREAARTVARGESTGQGTSIGRRVAGPGSAVRIERGNRLVVVTVTSPVRGPGGLFGFVHTFEVHARAVAVPEPAS